MKYPISVQNFAIIREMDYCYVDKTELVYELAQKHVCFLSRPRRFGKSLLISTLDAYFSGRKDLFKGLQMEELEQDWVEYPVFKIDFAVGDYHNPKALDDILNNHLLDWEEKYHIESNATSPGMRFTHILEEAAKQTGNRAVVLIDEYDKPILDVQGTGLEEKNRNTLRGFYGTFKAADGSLRFVLLTGVTKSVNTSLFENFNQHQDISMDSDFNGICGITEEELYGYFAEPIRDMAAKMGYTEEKMKEELKRKYDGYHFSKNTNGIYNPFSIINAFNELNIDDYWYRSTMSTDLFRFTESNYVNLQKLLSNEYDAGYFSYCFPKENPLAMLYQRGYITIKGYDKLYRAYTLDFPNNEVKSGFITLISNSYFKKPSYDYQNWIYNLDDMLRTCDLDGIRDAFTSFLSDITFEANRDERAKDFETHFSYTFYLIFKLLSCYTTLIEKQNSKGKADVIIETDGDVFIFEFKLDGSAKEALEQIEKQQYALPYLTDRRTVHRIGVNISSESRTVEEWEV